MKESTKYSNESRTTSEEAPTYRSVVRWGLFCMVLWLVAYLLVIPALIDRASAAGRDWSPCPTEDTDLTGQRCVWDAKHRGNHIGQSWFVNGRGFHPISDARAYDMLHRS